MWPLITALVVLATAVLGFIQTRNVKKQLTEVHVLVNSRLTSVLERVEQLSQRLDEEGIEIPPERNPR